MDELTRGEGEWSIPETKSKPIGDITRARPEARNYRCVDGPLAGEMHAGQPGWRMYVARKAEESRELSVPVFDSLQHLKEVDPSQSPAALGFYSLEELGPGDAVWGWTDFGRPWYTSAGFACDGGPLEGQRHPGMVGDHMVCVRALPDADSIDVVRLSGRNTAELPAYLAAFRGAGGNASLLGYYTLEPAVDSESLWRWTDLQEPRRSMP